MRIWILLIPVVSLIAFTGCSSVDQPEGLPKLYPCEITVTQASSPIEGAFVRLIPESGVSDWAINGKTDASGVAKISTHAKFSAAPEGGFKVLVSKTEAEPSKYPPPTENAPQSEWDEWRAKINVEKRSTYMYVKPEFDNLKQTPHKITITKGKNQSSFDVGEAIQIKVGK